MKHRTLTAVALLILTSAAHAQEPAKDVLSAYLRLSYAVMSKDLAATVATMPEEDFGFRPAGAVKEVRAFGDIVAHLVSTNAFVCSMGDGKPDPTASYAKTPAELDALARDKSRLVAFMNETNARCTAYLATVTDAALVQTVTGGVIQAVRGNSIVFAIAHSNEHYGNLVTYLRARGLVPPPTAAQARFFTPIPKPPTP
jgi:uncharacterized damage-inducible protein DinB